MESLLRPSHRNRASSANGFAKNAYDDVFAGPRKFGAPTFSSRAEDYKEIFVGSRSSSIPVLDLKETNAPAEFRGSKVDYTEIFGGFRENDVGLPYDELFAGTKRGKTSPGKAWTPVETGSPLQGPDRFNCSEKNQEFSSNASHQLFDGVKNLNMSYHKTHQRSRDGTNGTTHIAQLHAVPGFTCFIDEILPSEKTKGKKPKPPATKNVPRNVDSEEVIEGKHSRNNASYFANKQTSDAVMRSRSGYTCDASNSNNKSFSNCESNIPHTSKVSPASSGPANVNIGKGHPKRSASSNSEAPSDASEVAAGNYSPPFSDEELDINSVAAASITVLKKAMEKAQESIRIARESKERKNVCHQSCSNHSSKNGLKVKERRTRRIVREGNRIEENNAKEKCERMDSAFLVFDQAEGNSVARSGEIAPNIKGIENQFIGTKVVGETHRRNLESGTWFSVNRGKHSAAKKTLERQESIIKEVKELEETFSVEDMERRENAIRKLPVWEENVDKMKSTCFTHEHEGERFGITKECEESEEQQYGFREQEKCEGKLGESQEKTNEIKFDSLELKENGYAKRLNEAEEQMENGKEQQEAVQQEQIEKQMNACESYENENRVRMCSDEEKNVEVLEEQLGELHSVIDIINSNGDIQKRIKEVYQCVKNESQLEEAYDSEENEIKEQDPKMGEETESRLNEAHLLEIDEKRLSDSHDGEGTENRHQKECGWEGKEESVAGVYRFEETENLPWETHQSKVNEKTGVVKEAVYENNFDIAADAHKHIECDGTGEIEDASGQEVNDNKIEVLQEDNACEENGRSPGIHKDFCEVEEDEKEAEDYDTENIKNTSEPPDNNTNQIGQSREESELASNLKNDIEILVLESGEYDKDVKDNEISSDEGEKESNFGTAHREKEWIEDGKKLEASEVPNSSKQKEMEVDEEPKTSPKTEVEEENLNKTFAVQEKEARENIQKEEEKEHLRKTEEAIKRGREWEKDRIAVQRAIREARERAFAEARERAERTAVERATAEVRQRVLTEAREKLDKASIGTKSSAEKSSIEAKLRAERAAVERATAEARERALEKALSQKTASEVRAQAERQVGEKFFGASGDKIMRHSFSSSDLDRFDGTSNESAQRRKARLERHQRIMERVEKALAEKNTRDLLAQKEQAERNRLAEVLDAEIKRWASGKEGNLRALLSTLQYILGPNSGWQPISLTDIVTTSAVKKAYRKATLYVHPDKLQQRGASIQQKYTCEKVFDLLKAAWNKFNSEER